MRTCGVQLMCSEYRFCIIVIVMSATVDQVCILCAAVVPLSERFTHASTHTGGPAARPNLGGAVINDARYVMASYLPAATAATARTAAPPAVMPGATAQYATGYMPRSVEASRSGHLGAGANITPAAAARCLEYIRQKLGFSFDVNQFYLSFFEFVIDVNGSSKSGNLGAVVLIPGQGVSGDPTEFKWEEILGHMSDFGKTIAMGKFTMRQFIECDTVWDMAVKMWSRHVNFAPHRRHGTVWSNANGAPPSEFWKGSSMFLRRKPTNGESKEDMQIRATAYNNAPPEDEEGEIYSGRFDPAHNRVNNTGIPVTRTDPTAALNNRMALAGLSRKLRAP